MPRRFFKRLSRRRHELSNRWFIRPFRSLLSNPAYWSVHRSNVPKAVALALFVAFIPLPIHVLTVMVLALWWQVNVPVAIATVFVSNPLTIVPQFYLAYWVGSRILGTRVTDFAFEMSWQWLHTGLLPVWKPFLLGCLILGASSAALAYTALRLSWQLTLVVKYHERKRGAKGKNPSNPPV
jgi:uncharacterized protein